MKQIELGYNGSWLRAEELYEHGDPLFVAELRRITDAERLGEFAARWFADKRPEARRLMFDYLDQPLNAFRHEALVKRLFKLAEKAADHELVGRFLVLFDRSIRRKMSKRKCYHSQPAATQEKAEAIKAQWLADGKEQVGIHAYRQSRFVFCHWTEDAIQMPQYTTMWRPDKSQRDRPIPLAGRARKALEDRRLFSVATRHYLRRRAWRYFRKLGKQSPARYVAAVTAALKCYRDADVADGLALIDNWGLTHILFHDSPVLMARVTGWSLAPGKALRELAPAPKYEHLWKAAPASLLDLIKNARCRPVRQWAIFMIRRDHAAILKTLTNDDWLEMLASEDPVVVEFAAELLRDHPDVAALGVDRLLSLVESPKPDALEPLCNFLATKLPAERVPLARAVRLACSRPLPAARLGFTWLKAKDPNSEEECRSLLGLVEAQADPLREQLVRWMRNVLIGSPHFQNEWVLELLDSRYEEVRALGWQWLQAEPRTRDDAGIWQKLLESPYDDIRFALVAELEKHVTGKLALPATGRLNEELIRFLWATVLLNIHRGGRSKLLVIGQIVQRLERQPADAEKLLPILAVALRSLRGPEWRAGLAGIVQLVDRNVEMQPLVQRLFPELTI